MPRINDFYPVTPTGDDVIIGYRTGFREIRFPVSALSGVVGGGGSGQVQSAFSQVGAVNRLILPCGDHLVEVKVKKNGEFYELEVVQDPVYPGDLQQQASGVSSVFGQTGDVDRLILPCVSGEETVSIEVTVAVNLITGKFELNVSQNPL